MGSIDVYASTADVIAALSPLADGEPAPNEMGATELPVSGGVLVVATPALRPDVTLVAADSAEDVDRLARRAYDLLAESTSWRIELYEDRSGDLVAKRPALG